MSTLSKGTFHKRSNLKHYQTLPSSDEFNATSTAASMNSTPSPNSMPTTLPPHHPYLSPSTHPIHAPSTTPFTNHVSVGVSGGGGGGGTGSSSSTSTTTTTTIPTLKSSIPKVPSRTTKTSQKLTLFPDEVMVPQLPLSELAPLVTEAEDLYDQLTLVPPERIGKLDRTKLPRVSAYCTANSYRLDELMDYFLARACVRLPKQFDECVYLALPTISSRTTTTTTMSTSSTLPPSLSQPTFTSTSVQDDVKVPKIGDVFFFDYGVVVCWGFTEEEEKTLLMELMHFEEDSLGYSNIETEKFAFHYNSNYQSRIYNDIISLKDPENYMTKLTISHAIAQSTKLTLFEGLVEQTIAATKHIPQTMAETGKVPMNRTAITKKIGLLFIMRINVNLVSNVLDTPELFWAEPLYEPLYQAIRMYLEINQRVELLNQRVSVISDLLDMLKEHLNSTHGEKLEWIVIMLIAFEILIGIITICFDYLGYTGHVLTESRQSI